MKKIIKAFSLIELIVVIAIVAITSVAAFSAYKSYTIGARMANSATAFQAIVAKAIEYADRNGVFPSASQIGMGTNIIAAQLANDAITSAMIPYYLPATTGPLTGLYITNGGSCAKSSMWVTLSGSALGFTAAEADDLGDVWLECEYWHTSHKTMEHFCSYSYGTGASSGTANILPGWVNQNLTTGWDYSNPAYVDAMDRFNNESSCN